MKKLAILGLMNEPNQGDPLICECVKYLYGSSISDDVSWQLFDLRFIFKYFISSDKKTLIYKKGYSFIGLIYKRYPWKIFYKLKIFLLSKTYEGNLKNTNCGIIAGGGIIHYKFHDYALPICAFIKACNSKGIPIVINAVGIEGYDNKNIKCQQMRRYMSYPNVIKITTRDDLNLLKEFYLTPNSRCEIKKVIDPAVFSSQIFSLLRDPHSEVIGIGLIRSNIFKDYRVEYSVEDIVNYYVSLIKTLQKRELKFAFFINGFSGDLDLVPIIEERTGIKINVSIPKTPQELVETISGYKGIITARMHSCIVAYSLNIPAVAFEWCEKLRFWGETIGAPRSILSMKELNAETAIQRLEDLQLSGYNDSIRKNLMEMHLHDIESTCKII